MVLQKGFMGCFYYFSDCYDFKQMSMFYKGNKSASFFIDLSSNWGVLGDRGVIGNFIP